MGTWNQLLAAVCGIFMVIIVNFASAQEAEEMTPEKAVQNIANDDDLYLVVEAIRNNASVYINYMQDESTNTTLLLYATYYGRFPVVDELIKQGADVDAQDSYGQTAMIIAIKQSTDYYDAADYQYIISLLLAAGADVNLPEAPLLSPLHYAAQYGVRKIIKMILAKNPDVNRVDSNGETALMKASIAGKDVFGLLVEAGADIDIQDYDGETALQKSIENTRYYDANWRSYLCNRMLSLNASANLPPAPAWSLLHHAAHLDLPYIAEALIEAGAEVDRANAQGETALLVAADNAHYSVAEILLKAGANVDHQDNDGNTAMVKNIDRYYYSSSSMGQDLTHTVLLDYNADIELPPTPAQGPLHRAVYRGAPYISKSLIEAGANIERTDSQGKTPLLIAAEELRLVLRFLANAGANVNHQDNNGDTALTLLIKNAYLYALSIPNVLFDILIEAGANVELPATPASSPLHLAADEGLLYMVQGLIDAGANIARRDTTGRTATIIAAEEARNVLKPLIAAGADVDAQDNAGDTPLSKSLGDYYPWTYLHSSVPYILNDLLGASASVHLPDRPASSPLALAADTGNWYAVNELLDAGADVNRTDSTGMTSLMIAAMDGHSVVQPLIVAGTDIDHLDNDGETALLKACRYRSGNDLHVVVDYLLEGNADVNKRSPATKTPLHYSAERSDLYVTRRLLEEGASVVAIDSQGYTPLMSGASAYYQVRHSIVRLLLAGGSNAGHESYTEGTILHRLASLNDERTTKIVMGFCPDLDATNAQGKTAIEIAIDREHEEVLEALRGDYDGHCAYDLEIYESGAVRCEGAIAFQCRSSSCSWVELDDSEACSSDKRRRRSQGQRSIRRRSQGQRSARRQRQVDEFPSPTTERFTSVCAVTCPTTGGGPVCGTDGITYGSHCDLLRESCGDPNNIDVAYNGPCGGELMPTWVPPLFCSIVCENPEGGPVCGTDGNTYDNQCALVAQACGENPKNIDVAYEGPCKPKEDEDKNFPQIIVNVNVS